MHSGAQGVQPGREPRTLETSVSSDENLPPLVAGQRRAEVVHGQTFHGACPLSQSEFSSTYSRYVSIAKKKGEPAFVPSIATVADKSYPLARSLNMYTLGEPEPAVKAYLDWIVGPEGQKILEDEGYIPVTAVKAAKAQ